MLIKSKKLLSILLSVVMCALLFSVTMIPVFADDAAEDTTVEETAADETAEETTAEETEAETTAADTTVVISDVSNIIGIVVAVILGAGAIVAIILLAPKKNAPKKK